MLSLETASVPSAKSSPGGTEDKPRARFEAYVMTGDAILNLSRTTSSAPANVPIHKRRPRPPEQQQQQQQPKPSQSTPTSPVEKTFKLDDSEPSPPAKKSPSPPIRTAKSEENLFSTPAISTPAADPPKPVEKEERVIVAIVEKPMTTETKEPDRIVWTYNAAPDSLSEKERRRYEADQFWLNTRPECTVKQVIKQQLDEKISTVEDQVSPDVVVVNSTCDTLMNPSTCANKEEEEEGSPSLPSSPSGVGESANKVSRPLLTRSSTDEESDADSLQSLHFSPKAVDMPSAIRLAKRLYMLDGFHKSDVSRHLSRNNEFNRVVAEEYLKHFDFESLELDAALRLFLNAFQLTGESSERDGVLVHFSRRYMQSNPTSFSSQDGVHILTCALLLLNSDLHGKHPGMKRMTCAQFIKRLSGLNDGGNFPVDLLRRLYNAIKEHPLEWATDAPEGGISPGEVLPAPSEMTSSSGIAPNAKELASNPYLDIPTPSESQEFKKGYIMRKCCAEPGGKRTSLGKRSWKMYFAVLKDLCLYLYKDEATCKGENPAKSSTPCCKNKTAAGSDQQGPAALIRVHHALAASAPDYTKKKNVFRLFTSDRAQFLIQASDTKEWRCWMDAINTAASLLSSPPLAAPCGSQMRFERPLLPASLTQLSPRDQLMDHEERVTQLEQELLDHRANPPSKKAKSTVISSHREKDAFLHFEKTRYEAYLAVCSGLQAAIAGSSNPMSRDISLLEMDETPNDSGKASPDLRLNNDGVETDHL